MSLSDERDGKNLLSWAQSLKSDRSTWEAHWQEVRDFIAAHAMHFSTGGGAPGEKSRDKIYDNSAETVSQELAAAVHGMLCPPGLKWFSLRTVDARLMDIWENAVWLQEAERRMLAVFDSPASGFQTSLGEVFPDDVDFGTSTLYVEDRPGSIPRYCARPLALTYVAENADEILDTVFCQYELTPHQARQRFRDDSNLPAAVVKAADDPAACHKEKFTFWHLTFPRAGTPRSILATPGLSKAADRPYASIWLAEQDAKVCQVGGYYERPNVVSRWRKRAGEVYGRGPGMTALADVKMLQRSMKNTIIAAEKSTNPAMMLADDGVLGKIQTRAGAINYMNAELFNYRTFPVAPMPTGARPDLGEEFNEGVRTRIKNAYFLHLMRIPREPRMVVSQILELIKDKMEVMGPFLGREQNEKLGPVVERTFGILLRAGGFPPLPDTLAGAELKVEYESPASRAQRVAEAYAITQAWDAVAPILEAHPEATDNFDIDEQVRTVARELGVPARALRSHLAVQKIRAERNAAQQQQQQIEQADVAAGAIQKFGQGAAAMKGAGMPMGAVNAA